MSRKELKDNKEHYIEALNNFINLSKNILTLNYNEYVNQYNKDDVAKVYSTVGDILYQPYKLLKNSELNNQSTNYLEQFGNIQLINYELNSYLNYFSGNSKQLLSDCQVNTQYEVYFSNDYCKYNYYELKNFKSEFYDINENLNKFNQQLALKTKACFIISDINKEDFKTYLLKFSDCFQNNIDISQSLKQRASELFDYLIDYSEKHIDYSVKMYSSETGLIKTLTEIDELNYYLSTEIKPFIHDLTENIEKAFNINYDSLKYEYLFNNTSQFKNLLNENQMYFSSSFDIFKFSGCSFYKEDITYLKRIIDICISEVLYLLTTNFIYLYLFSVSSAISGIISISVNYYEVNLKEVLEQEKHNAEDLKSLLSGKTA